jgi:hypothetical protein
VQGKKVDDFPPVCRVRRWMISTSVQGKKVDDFPPVCRVRRWMIF